MRNLSRLTTPLGLLLLALPVLAQAQVTHHETAGNLKPTRELPCLAIKAITPDDSPADQMAALPRCLAAGRDRDAADLFTLAGVFAHFDKQRVADTTAHDAYNALKAGVADSVDEAQLTRFNAALAQRMADPKGYQSELCALTRTMPPPSYAPTYMLSHGMAAFTGKGGGLVPGFDAAAAWKNTRLTYLKCAG
ncbi:MAG: hypothetical protein RR704_21150 [Stenotrophomonas sp.]|uniref:hypothetical protein n=1 Tax=Stenotrophomonas sp. TaxID=69392 RepID=UPI002FCC0A3F